MDAIWCKGEWDYSGNSDDIANSEALIGILKEGGERFLLLNDPNQLLKNSSALDFKSYYGWPFDVYMYCKLFRSVWAGCFEPKGSYEELKLLVEGKFGNKAMSLTEREVDDFVKECDFFVLSAWGEQGLQEWLGRAASAGSWLTIGRKKGLVDALKFW